MVQKMFNEKGAIDRSPKGELSVLEKEEF